MIVPSIEITESHATVIAGEKIAVGNLVQLMEKLRPLAVFGLINLHLRTNGDDTLHLCSQLFRAFDCWISFESPPDQQTIFSWLDSGAKKLSFDDASKRPPDLETALPRDRQEIVCRICDLESGELEVTDAVASIDAKNIQSIESWVDHFCSRLKSDRPDGLWPTVVVDEYGVALGLVYSNRDSLFQAVTSGKGVYWSRSRNEIWEKGKTSGASSELLKIKTDCDEDALQFVVRQKPPGFCHLDRRSCFGAVQDLPSLHQWISKRAEDPAGYTARLLNDARLLKSKLTEEACELADTESLDESIWEAADVIYFTMVAMTRAGVSFDQVIRELDRRTGQLIRRKGDAKPKQ